MKKHFLPLFVLWLPLHMASAQSTNAVMNTQVASSAAPGVTSSLGINQYLSTMSPTGISGLNGTPYLDKRWLPARISLTNALPVEPMQLKYDILNGRILMRPLSGGGDSLQLNDAMLAQFELNEPFTLKSPERKRLFRRFTESTNPAQQREYVEVIHQGSFAVVKRYTKVIRAGSRTGIGETNDQIMSHEEYYLLQQNTPPVAIKLTAKSIGAAMPKIATELKAASATQKTKTDTDWAALLAIVDATK